MQELGDATMLANGSVVFSRMAAASMSSRSRPRGPTTRTCSSVAYVSLPSSIQLLDEPGAAEHGDYQW
jgi:hypothetical protein